VDPRRAVAQIELRQKPSDLSDGACLLDPPHFGFWIGDFGLRKKAEDRKRKVPHRVQGFEWQRHRLASGQAPGSKIQDAGFTIQADRQPSAQA
jgi:hypothetical protein